MLLKNDAFPTEVWPIYFVIRGMSGGSVASSGGRARADGCSSRRRWCRHDRAGIRSMYRADIRSMYRAMQAYRLALPCAGTWAARLQYKQQFEFKHKSAHCIPDLLVMYSPPEPPGLVLKRASLRDMSGRHIDLTFAIASFFTASARRRRRCCLSNPLKGSLASAPSTLRPLIEAVSIRPFPYARRP